mgnify:CR=1 FL=1
MQRQKRCPDPRSACVVGGACDPPREVPLLTRDHGEDSSVEWADEGLGRQTLGSGRRGSERDLGETSLRDDAAHFRALNPPTARPLISPTKQLDAPFCCGPQSSTRTIAPTSRVALVEFGMHQGPAGAPPSA